jgi:hypothetical protein
MASTPPTSPQRSQAAGRHAERVSRTLGSPEQRRTPAGPSEASAAAAPPSLPFREPVTFQGQTYSNLPTDLTARLASLPPLPAPRQRSRSRPSAAAAAPPSLPSREPITFQGQTYSNLPTNLTAHLASLPPLPAPQQRRRGRPPAIPFHAPAPVSLLLFIFILNLY